MSRCWPCSHAKKVNPFFRMKHRECGSTDATEISASKVSTVSRKRRKRDFRGLIFWDGAGTAADKFRPDERRVQAWDETRVPSQISGTCPDIQPSCFQVNSEASASFGRGFGSGKGLPTAKERRATRRIVRPQRTADERARKPAGPTGEGTPGRPGRSRGRSGRKRVSRRKPSSALARAASRRTPSAACGYPGTLGDLHQPRSGFRPSENAGPKRSQPTCFGVKDPIDQTQGSSFLATLG